MRQCPKCGNQYTDDSLEFCLSDGERLLPGRDSEATQIHSEMPPIQSWPPQPLPPPSWSNQPQPVQPTPPPRSALPIILYSLVALVALLGGALGILAFLRSTWSDDNARKGTPTPTPYIRVQPTPQESPEPDESPTPKVKSSPTPILKPTPESEPTPKPTPKPAPECVIYNDNPAQPNVNFRANCHIKSCDDDDSTILGTIPNGTPVTVNRQVAAVPGRSFNWQQVTLSNGRIGWVAASKIRCK